MSVVENEAWDAIALGFPPYRRSPLPSRTYQAFTQFLALFDQPSHLISPSPPIAPESGQEIQEKEETCFSKNNSLIENGVEDNETITHFLKGKEDGVEDEKEEGLVGEAEIEEGEISDINLPDDFDFDDFRQFGEPDVDLGQIHKDKQGECPAGVDEKGAYESDADERHIHKDKQGEFFASIKQKGAHESDAVEEQIHKDRQGEFPASIEEKGAHETDTDEGHIHKDKQGEFPASMENTGAYESAAVEGQIHKDKQGEFPASMENKGAYESDALVNSSDVGVGTSRETLSLEELKKKQAELSCRKICSYEEIVGDYGICDAEKEVKRSKASSKPDDAGNSKRIVDKNECQGCEAGSKRKRTEHSKKNKKEKRRKKRAEENRKSGVKRLRLEPNPKKKTINYCRYFLHGKCQQGDSCKFSHDTAPLTKTTVPCTHFAINNCLKGDNCPYDHDLSKYPCNNYKTTGFCRRGDKCFFSHKMSPMNDPSPVSDVSKNTQEASSLQARASSGKKLPTNGRTSQPTPMKPPANVPKGMNFLSFGKNPSDGSSKQEKGESPTVRGSEITVSGINQGAVERFDNPNERLWSQTPPAVSGINQGAVEKSYNSNERLWSPTPHAGSETNQGAVEKFQNSNERLWSPTPPVPQFSKMITNRQDKSTSNSAPHLKTQVKNASDSAQKAQPSSTSKYPAPSTASVGNLPTISNILQEFLFNGQ